MSKLVICDFVDLVFQVVRGFSYIDLADFSIEF